jgi:hypothetical protein
VVENHSRSHYSAVKPVAERSTCDICGKIRARTAGYGQPFGCSNWRPDVSGVSNAAVQCCSGSGSVPCGSTLRSGRGTAAVRKRRSAPAPPSVLRLSVPECRHDGHGDVPDEGDDAQYDLGSGEAAGRDRGVSVALPGNIRVGSGENRCLRRHPGHGESSESRSRAGRWRAVLPPSMRPHGTPAGWLRIARSNATRGATHQNSGRGPNHQRSRTVRIFTLLPSTMQKTVLLPAAWGEKKFTTSSS